MITDEQIRLLQNLARTLEKDPAAAVRFQGTEMAAALRAALAEIDASRDADQEK